MILRSILTYKFSLFSFFKFINTFKVSGITFSIIDANGSPSFYAYDIESFIKFAIPIPINSFTIFIIPSTSFKWFSTSYA